MRRVSKYQKIIISFGLFTLSLVSSFLAGKFLDANYPDAAKPEDLVLDNLGPYDELVLVGEILVIMQIGLLFYSVYRTKAKNLYRILLGIGIIYFLRSISIVVTPLAQLQDPTLNGSNPIAAPIFYKGMYFSGHAALTFFIYFIDEKRNVLKYMKLLLALVICCFSLLSHSHYSIDIIGGFLAAYFAANIIKSRGK